MASFILARTRVPTSGLILSGVSGVQSRPKLGTLTGAFPANTMNLSVRYHGIRFARLSRSWKICANICLLLPKVPCRGIIRSFANLSIVVEWRRYA